MKLETVINSFSSARAEYQSTSNSVYGKFVVPPFIDSMDLTKIKHSMSIVGGRGCGKTTYVRYFSHWTQFDKERDSVEENALDSIILYWKPDTAYCRSISSEWLSERNARQFFHSYSGLCIFKELLCALLNISHHYPSLSQELEKSSLFWSKIEKITKQKFDEIEGVLNWIEDSLYDVEISINTNDIDSIVNIDPKALLLLLLPVIQNDSSVLKNSQFKIFVDEFENLGLYQQKIINNYRKHSGAFLNWNVAHKRFASVSKSTDGDEELQQGDDYRNYILDDAFKDVDEEKLFLSELLLSALVSTGLTSDINTLNHSFLGDRRNVEARKQEEYRNRILNVSKNIFPTKSIRKLAGIALEMQAVKTRILEMLSKLEELNQKHIDQIISRPDIALATYAISTQKSFKVSDLISFIDSEFSTKHPYSQRVNTYLFASLLHINAKISYINIPLYSGLDRFYQLSTSNIRHFFDLCYNTFLLMDSRQEIDSIEDFPAITSKIMHQGALKTSKAIVKEIHTYAPMGLALNALVNRLGAIFRIWQEGKTQSEPEISHFYIKHDFGSLPEEINKIIEQAKCWRVLIEFDATKDKSSDRSASYEYILNPIYAPEFMISFRKIRRIEFTEKEFKDICFGNNKDFQVIRSLHMNKAMSGENSSSINNTQKDFIND